MNPVRIGVIGAGYWGPHLIRNVSEMSEARLCGIADLSSERLRSLQSRYPQVLLTQDYRDLLTDDIDALVIATPVKTHSALAREALRAGKHVLIEKPLTRTSSEALSLIHLAEQKGLALMVGHTFEYNPAVIALRDIIRSGDIGVVLYVDAARLNLGQFRYDINVLWDLAPHDISIMNLLLEAEPTHVSARGSSCVHPTNMHDVAYLELRYPNGVMGHIHVSWLEPAKVRRFTVVGDEKMIVYNDVATEEKLRIYDKGVIKSTSSGDFADFQLSYRYGGISIPAIPSGEPLKLEIGHFVDCIQQGNVPQSDGWSGLHVTRVLEAADKSLHNGGTRKRIRSDGELEVIAGGKLFGGSPKELAEAQVANA